MRKGFEAVAETPEFVTAKVRGRIPHWLEGRLYRIGPGRFSVPAAQDFPWDAYTDPEDEKSGVVAEKGKTRDVARFRHWFDGLSLLHEFRIHNHGKVLYRSRYLSKDLDKDLQYQGSADGLMSFGPTDPCKTVFQRVQTLFDFVRKAVLKYDNAQLGANGTLVSCTDSMY